MRRYFLILSMLFPTILLIGSVQAADTYPYRNECPYPSGGRYSSSLDVDSWNFWKCECTSYVSWRLNDDGVDFHNWYQGVHFSDAKTWKAAAESIAIAVDNAPRAGDVAWWDNGTWGHVAYVESVNPDNTVNISEYNYGTSWGYGLRYNIVADGYIHLNSVTDPTALVIGIGSNYSVGDTVSFTAKGSDDTALYKLNFGVTDANGANKYGNVWYNNSTSASYTGSFSTAGWSTGTYYYALWVKDAAGNTDSYEGSFILDNTGVPIPSDIIEDAEDGLTNGWSIYQERPNGASITNVSDTVKGGRVIKLAGDALSAYRITEMPDGNAIYNNTDFLAHVSIKGEVSNIYWRVDTQNGAMFIEYKRGVSGCSRNDVYITCGLDTNFLDGQWHTVVRDLVPDLKLADPTDNLLAVKAFWIRGNVLVDDIKLTKSATEIIEDAEDGNTNGWFVYDEKPGGASIANIFDSTRGNQVIRLQGDAFSAYRIIEMPDGSRINNKTAFMGHVSIKGDVRNIYWRVETSSGVGFIEYRVGSSEGCSRNGVYVTCGLASNLFQDGQWHHLTHDLVADLKNAVPTDELKVIKGFWVRGNARVDDIKLVTSNEEKRTESNQDTDTDGVATVLETNAPNNGDGNNDGIPDAQQANVVSLPNATNGQYLTLEASPANCTLENVHVEAESSYPVADAKQNYPYGLVGFEVNCQQADLTVFYHNAVDNLAKNAYRKYGPTIPGDEQSTTWYSLPKVAFDFVTIGGQPALTAKFSLTDGQLGDDTGVDGRIVDDGGLAEKVILSELVSFSLQGNTFTWETATELNTIGYYLWQAKPDNGDCQNYSAYSDVTRFEGFISAEGSIYEGASYNLEIPDVKPDHCYGLEEVDSAGGHTFYIIGPNIVEKWLELSF